MSCDICPVLAELVSLHERLADVESEGSASRTEGKRSEDCPFLPDTLEERTWTAGWVREDLFRYAAAATAQMIWLRDALEIVEQLVSSLPSYSTVREDSVQQEIVDKIRTIRGATGRIIGTSEEMAGRWIDGR